MKTPFRNRLGSNEKLPPLDRLKKRIAQKRFIFVDAKKFGLVGFGVNLRKKGITRITPTSERSISRMKKFDQRVKNFPPINMDLGSAGNEVITSRAEKKSIESRLVFEENLEKMVLRALYFELKYSTDTADKLVYSEGKAELQAPENQQLIDRNGKQLLSYIISHLSEIDGVPTSGTKATETAFDVLNVEPEGETRTMQPVRIADLNPNQLVALRFGTKQDLDNVLKAIYTKFGDFDFDLVDAKAVIIPLVHLKVAQTIAKSVGVEFAQCGIGDRSELSETEKHELFHWRLKKYYGNRSIMVSN